MPKVPAWKFRPLAAFLLLLSAVSSVAIQPTAVVAAPSLTVTSTGPESILIGETATFTVMALNATATPGYNTGFRVVLPAGVSLDSSTSPVTPQVFADAPSAGQTTIVWENVNDSQPNSTEQLSFTVSPSTVAYPVGATIDIDIEAYTSDDPRVVPAPNGTGIMGSFTGTGSALATTDVTAVTIDKTEPSSENELLRGVHDHSTVYTLLVENNPTNATNSLTVDDYLPAGLEFLGCGGVDNTTDAPTFPGNAVEYAGAPSLSATPVLSTNCPAPLLVETVNVDPDGSGPMPLAVYTHLQWSLGNLTPGQATTITYAAGIPLRENTLTWSGGSAPASTGAQVANLDNNNGPETFDEQDLENYATVAGTYTGPLAVSASNPVGDSDRYLVTAEDIRMTKGVSPTVVTQSTENTWTITIDSSEYRSVSNLDVTDTLPDGQCPLGPVNYDSSDSLGECDPTGSNPSIPYTSVTENNDGTWTIFWDDVATLAASDTIVLTFPSLVRTNYQENGADEAPVVTSDGFTNNVSLTGDDTNVTGAVVDEVDGTPDVDASSASQTANLPIIEKTISAPAAPGAALDCSTASYVDADDLANAEFAYRPGDRVCYTLRVEVPADLTLRNATVTDFLPDGITFAADLGPTVNNDITDVTGPVNFDTGGAIAVGDSSLAWEIGTTVIGGARYLPIASVDRVWEVQIEAEFTGTPTGSGSTLAKANLMKLTTQNTTGSAISLRDLATFLAVEPEVTIAKAEDDVDNIVAAGDSVGFTVTIANVADPGPGSGSEGYAAAENISVTDQLPSPLTCTDVVLDTIGGVSGGCSGSLITWTVASLDAAASIALTYTVTVPTEVGPGMSLTNTATLVSFEQTNNDAGTTPYLSGATAQRTLTVPGVTVAKLQQSAVGESGNSRNGSLGTAGEEATVGEEIDYRITATIPANVTVNDAYFEDILPADVAVVGTPTATIDLGEGAGAQSIPAAGLSFDGGVNPTRVNFPPVHATGANSDIVVIDLTVVVEDVPANVSNAALSNVGRFSWRNSPVGAYVSASSPSRTTRVVEPNPLITKSDDDVDGVVGAGQPVTFTLSITNPDRADLRGSTAHDLVVIDTLPSQYGTPTTISDGGVWAAGPRTITWNQASTPALASIDVAAAPVVLSYQVTTASPLTIGGSITNTADVTATSMAGSPAEERTTYGDTASNTVTTPAVTLAKALDPDTGPYTIGETVSYQLDVVVPQNARAFDVTATDTLPDGLVFDAVTAITPSPECSITGANGLTFDSVAGDGSTAIAFFLGDIEALGGDCAIVIDYTAQVDQTYNGTGSPADGVAVVSGNTLINSARANWQTSDIVVAPPSAFGDIPTTWAGQSVPVTTSITVAEPQLVIDKDVTPIVGCDSVHAATGVSDDDDCTVEPGDGPFTYTVTIRNSGTEAAHDIVVTDQPDAELVNVTPGTGAGDLTDGWTLGDPAMQWDIVGPLLPGGTLTLSYTADLVAPASLGAATTIDNTADVDSYFGLDAAARSGPSSERTYGSTFGPVVADTVGIDVDFPTLAVAKTVTSGAEFAEAFIGSSFGWRIAVTNSASIAGAFDVDVSDTLPVNWNYDAGSAQLCTPACVALADPVLGGSLAAGVTLDWSDVADTAAGASFEIRYTATPSAAVLADPGVGSSTDHVNTATATGDDASGASSNLDGSYGASPDTAAGRIHQIDLELDKEILTAGPYLQGQTVDYRVTVDNVGPDAATGVLVDEILDGGDLLWLATLSVDGSYDDISGVWNIGTIGGVTGTAVLELRAEIIGTGTITNSAQVVAADQVDVDSTPANAPGLAEDDDDSVTISAGTASLGSTVWYDVDNSGGDESTKGLEPGIAGVTVNLLSAGNDNIFFNADDFYGPDGLFGTADDITVTSLVTNGLGNYTFTDLPDGTYRVVIDPATLPAGAAGWVATFDDDGAGDHTSGDIVLSPGTPSYTAADFSYTGSGSLGDQLFWDVDASGDGILGAADLPLDGVDIGLTWAGFDDLFGTSDDVVHPAQATDASGVYTHGNLAPGSYRVEVATTDPDFPQGLIDQTWDVVHTAPGGGDGDPTATVDVTLGAGVDRLDVDFSFTGTASLGDTVWLDLDGDGIEDVGEPGIPGIDITLVWYGNDGVLGGGDDETFTTTTDASGRYLFTNLPVGTFSTTVVVADPDFPSGTTASFDLDGTGTADTAQTDLVLGQNRTDVDFGYVGVSSVGDTVWLDLDGDGTINGPEVGIAGVNVDVTWFGVDDTFGTADDVVVTTVTDAAGNYLVTGLPHGQVRVSVDPASLPAGLTETFDLDGTVTAHVADVLLDSGTPDRLDVDFGYRGTGSVGDLVWVDDDASGTLNGTEVGLDGVEVIVTLAGVDGILGTGDDIDLVTATSGGGLYDIDGLPAGPVRVRVGTGIPADQVQVSDPDGLSDGSWQGVLGVGESRTDIDFGYRVDADLSIEKSHSGEFEVGQIGVFELTITNNGVADAVDVVVTDTLPAGLTFVDGSATNGAAMSCTAATQTVTCTQALLANGESVTVMLSVNVAVQAAPSVINTATVSSATPDIDPTDNTDDDEVMVPLADVAIDKVLLTQLVAGQNATYRITVSNNGVTAARQVVVSDPLPSDLSYVGASGTGWVCSSAGPAAGAKVNCVLSSDLAPGQSASFELITRVATTASGSIVNNAAVVTETLQTVTTNDSDGASALVSPASITQQLAFTGSTTSSLVAVAALVMMLGGAMVALARRLRPATVKVKR